MRGRLVFGKMVKGYKITTTKPKKEEGMPLKVEVRPTPVPVKFVRPDKIKKKIKRLLDELF